MGVCKLTVRLFCNVMSFLFSVNFPVYDTWCTLVNHIVPTLFPFKWEPQLNFIDRNIVNMTKS